MTRMARTMFFFFFQAEDGIRDGHVTGVQTCALPIWGPTRGAGARPGNRPACTSARGRGPARPAGARSEERRVGKECISRWSPDHEKKQIKGRLGARKTERPVRSGRILVRTEQQD